MQIEHIAMYVNDLEGTRKFFETYFHAKSNDKHHNTKTELYISLDFCYSPSGFCDKKDFAWAVQTASVKKKMDCSSAEFLELTEGCHPRRQKNDKVNSQLTLQLLWSNMYQNDISN